MSDRRHLTETAGLAVAAALVMSIILVLIALVVAEDEGCPAGQVREFSHYTVVPQPKGGVVLVPNYECRKG